MRNDKQSCIEDFIFYGKDKEKFKEFIYNNSINISREMVIPLVMDESYNNILLEIANKLESYSVEESLMIEKSQIFMQYLKKKNNNNEVLIHKIISLYKNHFFENNQVGLVTWLYCGYEKENKERYEEIYNILNEESKIILLINSLQGIESFPFMKKEMYKILKDKNNIKIIESLLLDANDKKCFEYYKNSGKIKYKVKNKKYSAVFCFDFDELVETFPIVDEDVFRSMMEDIEEVIKGSILRTAMSANGDKILITLSSDVELNNTDLENYILNNMMQWIYKAENDSNIAYSTALRDGLFEYINIARQKCLVEKLIKNEKSEVSETRKKV